MKIFPPLLCALLLLCTLHSSFAATKTDQVERYLGKLRYDHDRPKGIVKFVFQKAILKRNGDGTKTYRQLLVSEPYFSNEDNAGRLIGIQVVYKEQTSTIRPEAPDKPQDIPEKPTPKKKTEPAPKKEESTVPEEDSNETSVPSRPSTDPVRPRGKSQSKITNIMPDSVALANSLENTKEKISVWQGQMWQTVRPIWAFFMWVFNSVIVLLICLGGLCRYVAKTAASESLINTYGRIIIGRWIVAAHQNAAAMLLVITWIVAIVMLIDVFMWLVYHSMPVWLLILIWFPILWIAEKITNWIVPNIPVLGPGVDDVR
jgi:hypothetical protein